MSASFRRRSPEGGFSLLELTVACALLVLALALANGLLVEAQRRLAIGARAQLEPDDTLYIPEDSGKKTVVTVSGKIVAFGLATISGVLIWGGR